MGTFLSSLLCLKYNQPVFRRLRDSQQKSVEAAAAERIEELVDRRVKEELERRREEIEAEVLRRVEEAKAVMEQQMLEELEKRKQEQLEEAERREVRIHSYTSVIVAQIHLNSRHRGPAL